MYKVVITDPIHPDGVAALEQHFNVRQFRYSDRTADNSGLPAALAEADAILVRAMPVTADLLAKCPCLRHVAKHGAGFDSIDIPAATRLGIAVTNCGPANARAVAEGALTLILATMRRIPQMHRIVQDGGFAQNWFVNRWETNFGSVSGKTLGLIGFGNIGRNLGRMCRDGFGMEVLAYDPGLEAATIAAAGARKVETVEEVMAAADVVSVHAPLMPATRHLIGAAQIACMKPSAVLVHTSRGGVVDEAALHRALVDGKIAGAGLDVHEVEPPRAPNPLFDLPNVVLTPHVGAGTDEAHREGGLEIARLVRMVAEGQRPPSLINADVWSFVRQVAHA